jgi:hypothetical protein
MEHESPRPVILVERERRANPVSVLLRLLGLLALVLLVALLALLLVLASNLAGVGSVADSLGGRARGALDSAAAGLERAAQNVGDRFDPAHPPRGLMTQDTEFAELTRVPAGGTLGSTVTRALMLVEVRSRPAAANPDAAEYAVLQSALITPRETRVFGLTVRRSEDRATHYLYKGESLRVGDAYYRVNWVSATSNEIAVVRYRTPNPAAPLKVQVD